MSEPNDAYTDLTPVSPAGENLLSFNEDGSTSVVRKLPDERPNKLKKAAREAIEDSGDEMIVEYPERETGYTYYRIGRIGVSYRGNDRFLCLTCVKVNKCPHADRVRRYRNEHLAELNFVAADPATEVPIV